MDSSTISSIVNHILFTIRNDFRRQSPFSPLSLLELTTLSLSLLPATRGSEWASSPHRREKWANREAVERIERSEGEVEEESIEAALLTLQEQI